jgi:hypothetical protein
MLRQVDCKIVDSRPLEPCRALSHRQPDNHRREHLSKPPYPVFRVKTKAIRTDFVVNEYRKPFEAVKTYPLGLFVNITA